MRLVQGHLEEIEVVAQVLSYAGCCKPDFANRLSRSANSLVVVGKSSTEPTIYKDLDGLNVGDGWCRVPRGFFRRTRVAHGCI